MQLTILGSGAMLPTKKRLPSSFLMEDAGFKMLIDCGHGTLARLAEMEIDPREIDVVFISHFHTDHIGDAFNMVHSRFVGDLYEGKSPKPLVFIGPRTLEERFLKWRQVSWPEPDEHYPLEFHEGELEYKVGSMRFQTFPVKHVPWFESIGVRMEINGKSVVYPGDVGSMHDFNDLINRVHNADLLLIEAAADNPIPNHLTIEQVGELAEKADVRRVIIVHIKPAPQWLKHINAFIKNKPNFSIAEDKMRINLNTL